MAHIYGVSHVSEIHSNFYLTSIYGATKDTIVKRNITLLINAAQELPKVELSGVESIKLFLDDAPHALVSVYFDRISDKIHEHLNRGGRVLVHCVLGVSRSTSLCLAYFMKHKNMSLKQAFDHIASRRPIARPNPGFWRQLIDYERRLTSTKQVQQIQSSLTNNKNSSSSLSTTATANGTSTNIPITIISTGKSQSLSRQPSSSLLYTSTSNSSPAQINKELSAWAASLSSNNSKLDSSSSKLYNTKLTGTTSSSASANNRNVSSGNRNKYTTKSSFYDTLDYNSTPIVSSISVQPSYNTHRTNLLVNEHKSPTFSTTYRSSYSRF